MQMSFLGAVKSDSSRGGDDFNGKRKRPWWRFSVANADVMNALMTIVEIVNLMKKVTALLAINHAVIAEDNILVI